MTKPTRKSIKLIRKHLTAVFEILKSREALTPEERFIILSCINLIMDELRQKPERPTMAED